MLPLMPVTALTGPAQGEAEQLAVGINASHQHPTTTVGQAFLSLVPVHRSSDLAPGRDQGNFLPPEKLQMSNGLNSHRSQDPLTRFCLQVNYQAPATDHDQYDQYDYR